jgi:hypothetical protein
MEKETLDRLGLAWCRLNRFEWDDLIGPKPDGFDALPNNPPKRWIPFLKRKPSKTDYIAPALDAIESIIGEANTSRYWWTLHMHRTEEEWFRWYTGIDGPFQR